MLFETRSHRNTNGTKGYKTLLNGITLYTGTSEAQAQATLATAKSIYNNFKALTLEELRAIYKPMELTVLEADILFWMIKEAEENPQQHDNRAILQQLGQEHNFSNLTWLNGHFVAQFLTIKRDNEPNEYQTIKAASFVKLLTLRNQIKAQYWS